MQFINIWSAVECHYKYHHNSHRLILLAPALRLKILSLKQRPCCERPPLPTARNVSAEPGSLLQLTSSSCSCSAKLNLKRSEEGSFTDLPVQLLHQSDGQRAMVLPVKLYVPLQVEAEHRYLLLDLSQLS